jgi:hypothetical protein
MRKVFGIKKRLTSVLNGADCSIKKSLIVYFCYVGQSLFYVTWLILVTIKTKSFLLFNLSIVKALKINSELLWGNYFSVGFGVFMQFFLSSIKLIRNHLGQMTTMLAFPTESKFFL